MGIKNYYYQIPKKTYKNYCSDMPQHPFQLAMVGPSNSGKTNILMNLIHKCRNLDKLYLYAKKLDEPLYEVLIKKWIQVGKKYGKQLIEVSNDIADVVHTDHIGARVQNLIIFDDMVTEKNLKAVEDLFIRG